MEKGDKKKMVIFRDKTKIFERVLYSCSDCPNLSTPRRGINYCLATEKYIEDASNFPEWCPLNEGEER